EPHTAEWVLLKVIKRKWSEPRWTDRQDSMDDVKKVMRREQNRVAAQKSRMWQTQKADSLRLESEKLERENAVLGREVNQLTEEAKCLSAVLSHHQPLCCAVDLHSSTHQYLFEVYKSLEPTHEGRASSCTC
uniref:Basic leucine zipper transcriptional factor ATF-like n=1 Tax=Paramormyrops kingsleyae TaxID=1676925 RepID=A0A3B3RVI8_9TELE